MLAELGMRLQAEGLQFTRSVKVDLEPRVRSLAKSLGLDPDEAVAELVPLIEPSRWSAARGWLAGRQAADRRPTRIDVRLARRESAAWRNYDGAVAKTRWFRQCSAVGPAAR